MSQFLAAIDENYLSRESRWVDEYPLRGTEVTIGDRKFHVDGIATVRCSVSKHGGPVERSASINIHGVSEDVDGDLTDASSDVDVISEIEDALQSMAETDPSIL